MAVATTDTTAALEPRPRLFTIEDLEAMFKAASSAQMSESS